MRVKLELIWIWASVSRGEKSFGVLLRVGVNDVLDFDLINDSIHFDQKNSLSRCRVLFIIDILPILLLKPARSLSQSPSRMV